MMSVGVCKSNKLSQHQNLRFFPVLAVMICEPHPQLMGYGLLAMLEDWSANSVAAARALFHASRWIFLVA